MYPDATPKPGTILFIGFGVLSKISAAFLPPDLTDSSISSIVCDGLSKPTERNASSKDDDTPSPVSRGESMGGIFAVRLSL